MKQLQRWILAAGMVGLLWLSACAAASPVQRLDAPAASPALGSTAAPEMAQAGGDLVAEQGRKIIARATLSLIVADTQATVVQVETMMEEVGGYVASTNLYRATWHSPEALQGTLTLRVPAESLDATLDDLAALAVHVESRGLNREDITDQYSDTDAQIRNLEATETELRAMLEEVRARPNATAEDIMAVYRTLTEVRGEIETLRGRKNVWDNLIGLSTIELSLTPDSANLPVVDDSWRPGAVAREAQRALVDGLQGLGTLLIWFVIAVLPILILALIPLVVTFWALRWLLRRLSRPKKAVAAPSAAPKA